MDNQSWHTFDADLRIRLQEYNVSRVSKRGHIGHAFLNASEATKEKDLSQELAKLTTCVKESVEAVVPKRKKQKRNGRTMSKETMELHEKRKRQYSKKSCEHSYLKKCLFPTLSNFFLLISKKAAW